MTTLRLIVTFVCIFISACHAEHEGHDETIKLPVTTPLRKDTEIAKDFVAQIHAIQHIELRALERGYLQGIFVDEGQVVEKGQKMFQIMPLLYQAELAKAGAEAEFAAIEFKNTKLLAEGKVVSPNELSLAKAKLDKARAELSIARVHRGMTEIKAPFPGIMGRFHVRLGSLVDEGELLTTLSDNSTVWVYFNLSESEYLAYKARTKEAKTETIQLVMANGAIFGQPGKIDTIEADFNNETGNIAFRASFPNPDGLLRHGETGKILMTEKLDDAIIIPQKATFDILDKKFVFVIDEENVVRSRQIEVEAELPHLYVIESGVSEKDKILLEGLRKVNDGVKIEPSFQEPAEAFANLEVPAQ